MRLRFILLGFALAIGWSEVAHAQPASWSGPPRAGKKYSVSIDSAPQGAMVYLEEEAHGAVGVTPIKLKLAAGTWKVILKKNGYEVATRPVTVKKTGKAQDNFVPLIEADNPAMIDVTADSDSQANGAAVWLDGQLRGQVPVKLETPPGRHLVEIKKQGAEDFSQWVTVKQGERAVVNPKLRGDKSSRPTEPLQQTAAALTVVSDVAGAIVSVDGKIVGKTPFSSTSLAPGNHTVSVRATGFPPKEDAVQLLPGVPLTVELNFVEGASSEPPPAELPAPDFVPPGDAPGIKQPAEIAPEAPVDEALVRRGLSSQGARPNPPRHSTIDLSVGYPYYFSAGVMVGVADIAKRFALDAGVTLKTFFSRTELGLRARLRLVDAQPISVALFADVGGGSNFVDKSGRNTFSLNGGAAASLTGLGMFTVTGRAYLNIYSDRHCPEVDAATMQFTGGKPIDTCTRYLDGTLSAGDRAHIDEDLLDGPNDIFTRDNGLRLMTGITVEIAISERNNMWIMVEGAPFQEERGAFTHLFSKVMFDEDPMTYLAVGTTYKF